MVALILASGVDPQRSVVFHQDEVADSHFAVFSGFPLTVSNRSRTMLNSLDSELSNADRKAEAVDDVEGT